MFISLFVPNHGYSQNNRDEQGGIFTYFLEFVKEMPSKKNSVLKLLIVLEIYNPE